MHRGIRRDVERAEVSHRVGAIGVLAARPVRESGPQVGGGGVCPRAAGGLADASRGSEEQHRRKRNGPTADQCAHSNLAGETEEWRTSLDGAGDYPLVAGEMQSFLAL